MSKSEHIDGSNRIFNVNGAGLSRLTDVLGIAFRGKVCACWTVTDKNKMILFHRDRKQGTTFPAPMGHVFCAEMINEWLQFIPYDNPLLDECDKDPEDHDISVVKGWRVYVEKYGHVNGQHSVLCAVTPAYLHYGK